MAAGTLRVGIVGAGNTESAVGPGDVRRGRRRRPADHGGLPAPVGPGGEGGSKCVMRYGDVRGSLGNWRSGGTRTWSRIDRGVPR